MSLLFQRYQSGQSQGIYHNLDVEETTRYICLQLGAWRFTLLWDSPA